MDGIDCAFPQRQGSHWCGTGVPAERPAAPLDRSSQISNRFLERAVLQRNMLQTEGTDAPFIGVSQSNRAEGDSFGGMIHFAIAFMRRPVFGDCPHRRTRYRGQHRLMISDELFRPVRLLPGPASISPY